MRRTALPIVALAFLLAACGGGDGGGSRPDSGIRGRVLVGPQCPIEAQGSPCPDRPFVGTVRAIGDTGPAETQTDSQGRFVLALEPGTYVVQAVVRDAGPPTAFPETVHVEPGAFVEVTLEVDTGIR